MSYTRDIIGIEEFANRCCFTLRGHQLSTCCYIRDLEGRVHKLERTVDLAPAIDYVTRQLAAWHAQQHGTEPTVAGWTDFVSKAVSTVKKVAQNKTVKSLYNQAKPFLKAAVKDIPGGETTLALATKAASVYDQAKKGSQEALAKVQQVKQLAAGGDPKAQFAVKVMQNVSTIVRQKAAGLPGILPEVAHAVQAQQAQRDHRLGKASYYHLGVTSVSGEVEDYNDEWNPHYDIVGSFLSKAKWAVPGYAAYRGAKAIANHGKKKPARPMDHRAQPARGPALQKQWNAAAAHHMSAENTTTVLADRGVHLPAVPAALAEAALPPMGPQSTTPDMPTPDQYYPEEDQDYQDGYVDDSYYDDGSGAPYMEQEEPADQEVAGWRYNRPYRSLSQSFLQSQKSPGVSMAARELYNRGLGREPTSLSQLALEALHELG